MPTDDVADRVRAALERFERARPAVEAAAPWPLAERFDTSEEASWGPPEVLAHVSEMLEYWRAELERVAAGDGDAGAVRADRDRHDPARPSSSGTDPLAPAELFARIDVGLGAVPRRRGPGGRRRNATASDSIRGSAS